MNSAASSFEPVAQTPPTSGPPEPLYPYLHKRSFLPIVILLLVAVVISAGVSVLLLTPKSKDRAIQPVSSPSFAENPFLSEPATNPFVDSAEAAANPFAESDENDDSSANPFTIFEDDTTVQQFLKGEYQNPF